MKQNHLVLSTFAILLAVFLIGIVVGRATTSSGVDELTMFIKNNELNTESYLIERELIGQIEEGDCAIAGSRMDDLSSELWAIGQKLLSDDARAELGDEEYNFIKRKYHLRQIRAYILMKSLREVCPSTGHAVLFYFSQSDQDSFRQGQELDRAVASHNVSVFAIEHNYSRELNFLEDYYRISYTPTIIVDYKEKFAGFASYEEIAPLLG